MNKSAKQNILSFLQENLIGKNVEVPALESKEKKGGIDTSGLAEKMKIK